MSPVCVYTGEALARYNFGEDHPFGPLRHGAFMEAFRRAGLDRRVRHLEPVTADQPAIERFHTPEYVERVVAQSRTGGGLLDQGDTPAFRGVYEAAATVVGTVLDGVGRLVESECRRVFVPIAGLHHARRGSAAGFCVFNDVGVAVESLRSVHGIRRIAYVDIDAHHGDGVFYAFETDPDLIIVDFHEDGHFLYPGTGAARETGRGDAVGTKLNIPMPPDADDDTFLRMWERGEAFIDGAAPEFVIFQCGADSLEDDPITHLRYSASVHGYVAERLCRLADKHASGRLLALGGGGYRLENLAAAWCAVVEALVEAE